MGGAVLPLPQYVLMAWCSVEAQVLYLTSALTTFNFLKFIVTEEAPKKTGFKCAMYSPEFSNSICLCTPIKVKVKVKGKVVPVLPLTEHHAMKAYWGSRGTAPPIL
jgi:hypothetical protein